MLVLARHINTISQQNNENFIGDTRVQLQQGRIVRQSVKLILTLLGSG